MRRNIGPFGLKDVFTLVNLMGGVGAIVFVVQGNLPAAGLALLAGYLLGDALDGPVARLTKTSNRFGSELDTATDHFVQAIAPAVIVYGVYARGGHPAAGVALMSILIATGTIRQALFSVAKMGDPLMYCGLPRTVSGYAAMAFVLSRLFFAANPARYATGAVLVSAFALLNLLPIPYMAHRGGRRMQTYVKLLSFGFVVTPVAAVFVARDYVFDVLFFWMFGYVLTAWIPIYPEEKRAFYARYRQWAREVAQA
ncbi:MAG TPA: CDP-alcohol phosphatidyltransferase family protein [Polyangia bacterium]|nr:CDP-alcohol phosphatidyltransferase family protein [Polyangia bacterium]